MEARIQIELAAVVNAGKVFVKATYNIEDGPLALRCFEILRTLTAGIQVAMVYHDCCVQS